MVSLPALSTQDLTQGIRHETFTDTCTSCHMIFTEHLFIREKKNVAHPNNIHPSNGLHQSLGLMVSCATSSPEFCQHATDMNFSFYL